MSVLQRLRERFWFIPAVLCLAAFIAAEVLVEADRRIGVPRLPTWADLLLYRVGDSGSRDILGAIATSSLAVAGTTFSITIAVLALTSSNYGPRLVRNFMADRGNQFVLGVFVATFLYSLLVMRSISGLGDPGRDADAFVPHLAVNLAVLLAVLNVGVLVYFIHHISDSIQISTLASGVRAELFGTVDRLYPEPVGRDAGEVDGPESPEGLPEQVDREGAPIRARRPGYLTSTRSEALMAAAERHDTVLALKVRPGQYVLEGSALAVVHPPDRLDDDLADDVRSAMEIGNARTPHQDVEFAVQQLTEMAVRALSPGTNDPYTAINALDDLSAGMARLAGRRVPSPARYDDAGRLRVHAPGADVVALVGGVVDAMRWYAAGAPSVMHATLEFIERVGVQARSVRLRVRLLNGIDHLREAFSSAGNQDHDVEVFGEHADRVTRALARA